MFTKKQSINLLKDGDSVDDIFVVKIKKSIMPYKGGMKFGFMLVLSDSSGASLEYKYWGGEDEEKVKEVHNTINEDSVIAIKGVVSTFNGKLQVCADDMSYLKVLDSSEYDADFVPVAKRDLDEMELELKTVMASIVNEQLRRLLALIFDETLMKKFKTHPGAIQIHHNWIGGLMQHTLEIISLCETCIKLNPSLDRDLLLTGAILHDIGKLEELEVTSRIKGSRKGQLVGHLTLGVVLVSQKLDEVGVDELLKEKLLHLITSHHGKLEYGSPKTPMMPEAFALYYADELSSKLSEIVQFVEEKKVSTEDNFMYHNRNGNILLR